jgi:transposase
MQRWTPWGTHLLALHVTAANEQDREQAEKLAEVVQEATGEYSGETVDAEAQAHGIQLEVVKHLETRRGFVLLPRRWVVERDFAWASRFRRLVRDYERLPQTVAGLHFVAFACLFLRRAIAGLGLSP